MGYISSKKGYVRGLGLGDLVPEQGGLCRARLGGVRWGSLGGANRLIKNNNKQNINPTRLFEPKAYNCHGFYDATLNCSS
jgi:hypothetical protein